MPVGGGSSTVHISLQLSTASGGRVLHSAHVTSTLNCQWGEGPPQCTCHFNSHLPIGAGPQCCAWHFNSQLLPVSHIVWGWGYPQHLTTQVECTSAVKPNWLPSLYASKAWASAGIKSDTRRPSCCMSIQRLPPELHPFPSPPLPPLHPYPLPLPPLRLVIMRARRSTGLSFGYTIKVI